MIENPIACQSPTSCDTLNLLRHDPRLTILSLQELARFGRVGEGFCLRVEGEASFAGAPGDIRQMAKQRGPVALLHIHRRQRPGSNPLQEVLDMALVTLSASDVFNHLGIPVKDLPAIAMPTDAPETAGAEHFDACGVEWPVWCLVLIAQGHRRLLHVSSGFRAALTILRPSQILWPIGFST